MTRAVRANAAPGLYRRSSLLSFESKPRNGDWATRLQPSPKPAPSHPSLRRPLTPRRLRSRAFQEQRYSETLSLIDEAYHQALAFQASATVLKQIVDQGKAIARASGDSLRAGCASRSPGRAAFWRPWGFWTHKFANTVVPRNPSALFLHRRRPPRCHGRAIACILVRPPRRGC